MAQFIPDECNEKLHPKSEQFVFKELHKYLSDEWTVFYSWTYLKKRFDDLNDGEIDFLLYHEQKGILVLEVKGGEISYRNRQWFSNKYRIDPVNQALKNKFAVMNLLKEHFHGKMPAIRLAHAICFPDCDGSLARGWPAEAHGIVVTRDQLPNIERIASHLLAQDRLPRDVVPVTRNEVLDVLSPSFEYALSLKERMKDDEADFIRLTEGQSIIMNALRDNLHLLVIGGAGTGKTVLAVKMAREIANGEGKVLFLCYNELLAQNIRKKLWGPNVMVGAFFEYCLEQMNVPKAEQSVMLRNQEALPKILADMEAFLQEHPVQVDAIVVDEAQDFTTEMWEIVLRMLKPDGLFYVFYDPDQNIFREQLSIPDFDGRCAKVRLMVNCRNTVNIYNAMRPYCSTGMVLSKDSPMGTAVIERQGDCRALLLQEFERLFKKELVAREDVVVIGGHSLVNSSLGNDANIGVYRLVEQPNSLHSKEVAYYTYMKFKGCESKVVILLDVDENDPRWNRNGLYTAMSRAAHQLIILRRQ